MPEHALELLLKDTATVEAFVLGMGIRAGPLRFFLGAGLGFQEHRWIREDCQTDDDPEKACLTLLWIESEGCSDDELNLTLRDHVAFVVDTHAACPSWGDPQSIPLVLERWKQFHNQGTQRRLDRIETAMRGEMRGDPVSEQ